jgi:hypothetical protein
MKAYSRSDEENVRHQAMVRDWVSSGLLDATQGSVLQADLQVSLRRTNSALRAVLAFFTMVILFAAVSLTGIVLHVERDAGWIMLGLGGQFARYPPGSWCVARASIVVEWRRRWVPRRLIAGWSYWRYPVVGSSCVRRSPYCSGRRCGSLSRFRIPICRCGCDCAFGFVAICAESGLDFRTHSVSESFHAGVFRCPLREAALHR